MKARFIAHTVPHQFRVHDSENHWTGWLSPTDQRNLRAAARGFLLGVVSREDMKATINASKLVAISRQAAALRGGVL